MVFTPEATLSASPIIEISSLKRIDFEIINSSVPQFLPSWIKALYFNSKLFEFFYSTYIAIAVLDGIVIATFSTLINKRNMLILSSIKSEIFYTLSTELNIENGFTLIYSEKFSTLSMTLEPHITRLAAILSAQHT